MIDRRMKRDFGLCETDPALLDLSDHEILMSFRGALTAIYPSLKRIRSHVGDAWDSVSEGLFYSLVHLTFAGKYGIPVPSSHIHKYGFSKHCYRRIIHVECVPSCFPLSIRIDGVQTEFAENDLEGRALVLLAFIGSDGEDPSFMDLEDSVSPSFLLASVEMMDVETGLRFRNFESKSLSVSPEDVDFHWVVEDFDPEEHEFHKPVFYDGIG
jgi:hypothetical protein